MSLHGFLLAAVTYHAPRKALSYEAEIALVGMVIAISPGSSPDWAAE